MPARLAPTPSGFLHHGNAANFALNALLASAHDGRLLLRIDDLDRGRFREEYLEDIFQVIDWLGIAITDGPADVASFHTQWSQEYRMTEYRAALEQLRDHPLLFACPCSRRELATGHHHYGCLSGKVSKDQPGIAWRINTRELPEWTRVPDLVAGEGFQVALHREATDFSVRKKDGRPSYQLACTVDDALFGITHVGRGQDLLPSTAAQALLSDLLTHQPLFNRIHFVHHPLLKGANGEKLSKSAGAERVSGTKMMVSAQKIFALAKGWLPVY